jgi:hypothetical protein
MPSPARKLPFRLLKFLRLFQLNLEQLDVSPSTPNAACPQHHFDDAVHSMRKLRGQTRGGMEDEEPSEFHDIDSLATLKWSQAW